MNEWNERERERERQERVGDTRVINNEWQTDGEREREKNR